MGQTPVWRTQPLRPQWPQLGPGLKTQHRGHFACVRTSSLSLYDCAGTHSPTCNGQGSTCVPTSGAIWGVAGAHPLETPCPGPLAELKAAWPSWMWAWTASLRLRRPRRRSSRPFSGLARPPGPLARARSAARSLRRAQIDNPAPPPPQPPTPHPRGYYTLLAWLLSYFELALGLNVQESSFLTLIPWTGLFWGEREAV